MTAMNAKPSISEDNGVAALTAQDLNVYSIGISTGGVAEIRMAKAEPGRHIIATTIDEKGARFAAEQVKEQGFDSQIEVKLEDVSKPLLYADNYFDFVYARLVLHYLPKQDLQKALSELHRVLKSGGRMFVVVRSTECDDAKGPNTTYDPETCLTTHTKTDQQTGHAHTTIRYFHTEDSISGHLRDAGFNVQYAKPYAEQLYKDFMRTDLSDTVDHVIELVVDKP